MYTQFIHLSKPHQLASFPVIILFRPKQLLLLLTYHSSTFQIPSTRLSHHHCSLCMILYRFLILPTTSFINTLLLYIFLYIRLYATSRLNEFILLLLFEVGGSYLIILIIQRKIKRAKSYIQIHK